MTSSAIRFVLDNCALQDLVELAEYAEIKRVLCDAREAGKIQIYVSQLTYLEISNSIRTVELNKLQRWVKEGLSLSGNAVLTWPQIYVQHVVGKVDVVFVAYQERRLLENMHGLLKARSKDDLSPKWLSEIEEWQNLIKDFHCQHRSILRETAQLYFGDSEVIEVESWLRKGKDIFQREIVEQTIKKLLPNVRDDLIEVARCYPSLDCWAEYWYAYLTKYKQLYDKRQSQAGAGSPVIPSPKHVTSRGDTIDSLTVWYLDRCDYIVTEDEPFTNLLNEESTNRVLTKRAISLKEFLEHVENPYLICRALVPAFEGSGA